MILSKTQSVMRRISEHAGVTYANGSSEPGDETTRLTTIDRQTYNDLGQPFEITVTIEPGDLLNKEEVPQQPVIRLPRLAGSRELARDLIDETGDIRGWDVVIDTRELRSAAPSFVQELLTGLDAAGARTVVITYLHPDFAALAESANHQPMTATTEGRDS